MGRHARPTRGGNLLSMRSTKQTERQQLLMESSLAYPRGKEEKSRNSKGRQNLKGDKALGYLGVVNLITPEEGVPLRGPLCSQHISVQLETLRQTKCSICSYQLNQHR
ncbi:hypothetical protein AVEN_250971-1 [Araneus ventricosus]|uniref:Uncharacterized protein n=1 Tax=Araneus ventricosus TaxID=182803 RepID=A0A4Y2P3P4_ARAVE|nr:hypothetical protein AVEN_250971-1 [Araneus ventricosus]